MSDESPSSSVESQAPEISGVGRRIVAVFTSPGAVFASLARQSGKADWLLPLLIVAAFTLVYTLMTFETIQALSMEKVREQFAKNPNMTAEKQEQALEMAKKIGGVAALVSPPVTVAALTFVQGLVLWGLTNLLLGGRIAYGKALSVAAYGGLIGIPALLVAVPLVRARGLANAQIGLNLVLPESMAGTFPSYLLGMFNVFSIWQCAVVAIGLGAVAGIATKKAAIGVFVLFAVYAVAAAAIGTTFAPKLGG